MDGVILLKKENVNMFKLPTMGYGRGYYLDTWKDKIWIGYMIRQYYHKVIETFC